MAVSQNNTSAYDLSLFEERKERRTIKVIKNNNPTPSLLFGLSPATVLFTAIIVVAITSLFIYNNVVLTEIGAQINSVAAEAADLESEHVRLQASLENKLSVKNIETSAENSMGLVKMDRSQIEYINLAPNDVVEVAEQDLANGNLVEKVIAKIKEYLNK
ncbi:hypothetical protein EDD70_0810 [Hydrogenoanaerobacterium saccharovorans]|uniref:Cell division protein FtsL n=1 Tax=Hydrogenoanaerobacterium saccharovorans TaxID=474960 RepID=A0A1H8AGC5_9FIRM|nr:hypothetical protein [Hydrogenoanaerobacterium saccharovorans]RPF48001.1 hypothetical protein EDD70_0810 [Hydrogenoanaerobacterium saccharovorans]SEM68888.1 hypothetical protein SAMN05216180_1281 [Hydrogenoanaerobacterium saccharovorans]